MIDSGLSRWGFSWDEYSPLADFRVVSPQDEFGTWESWDWRVYGKKSLSKTRGSRIEKGKLPSGYVKIAIENGDL